MIEWRDLRQSDGAQLGVLGDPINHSLSPKMHQAALEALGIKGRYVGLKVLNSELEECLEHLSSIGFIGVNLTIPHKEAGAQIAVGDETVRALRAANTLRFAETGVEAINTDVGGFGAAIESVHVGKALVLGAGGAALAAIFALARSGWDVSIWNRSRARAEDVARRFGASPVDNPSPAGCSLIVNATPIGVEHDEMPPIEWDQLVEGATVFDMVYRQGPTPFLEKALSRGADVIDGRDMLVEQGALSLEWWTGRIAPRQAMRHAVGL